MVLSLAWGWAPLALAVAMATQASPRPSSPLLNRLWRPDAQRLPFLYAFTDCANSYCLVDGDAALLIELGDGGILNHLPEIGVHHVEALLLTSHHRENLQGHPRLAGRQLQVAGPEAERPFLEHPTDYRRMTPRLEDLFTVYGASFVRPPVEPLRLNRGLRDGETFRWHDFEFRCVSTPGPAPGSMSYLLNTPDGWLAFTGDVMRSSARMNNWFDTEWDYGYGAGLFALAASVSRVAGYTPRWLLPAHGPAISHPARQMETYRRRLRRLAELLPRGYPVGTMDAAGQDNVSRPTETLQLWRISPHLYKLRGPGQFGNFTLLLADSGHALVVDCGLLDPALLHDTLEALRRHHGLRALDALIVSHMHGDHFLQADTLKREGLAEVWGLDRMADVCRRPLDFDYAAMLPAYNPGFLSLPFDRTLRHGEIIEWEGYHLTVEWLPGQTEFGLGLFGEIDGRKVAFTGDTLFGDPSDPRQTGHEAVVARNSAILEEGYMVAAKTLSRWNPDLIVGGHSFVMDHPAGMIRRFGRWTEAMRRAFQDLSPEDYRYRFDPYWVRADPYRLSLRPGGSATVTVHVRNFDKVTQRHEITVHSPVGWDVEPHTLKGEVAPESRGAYPIRITLPPDASPGPSLIALDVTRNGQRYGEWFDFIVEALAQ